MMGAKEPMGRYLWALAGVVALFAIVPFVAEHNAPPPPTPEQVAERKAESDRFVAGGLGERMIREMLRDPDSASFSGTYGRIRGDLGIGCGYVNAKNGFGGMTGKSPWIWVYDRKAMVPVSGMVRSNSNSGTFNPLWNKYCAGPDEVRKAPASH
jgi:hypothetical protein